MSYKSQVKTQGGKITKQEVKDKEF